MCGEVLPYIWGEYAVFIQIIPQQIGKFVVALFIMNLLCRKMWTQTFMKLLLTITKSIINAHGCAINLEFSLFFLR